MLFDVEFAQKQGVAGKKLFNKVVQSDPEPTQSDPNVLQSDPKFAQSDPKVIQMDSE